MVSAVFALPTSADRGSEVLAQHTIRCLTVVGSSSRRHPVHPDDTARTQLDLYGEGPVAYACINEGPTHTSLLNDQGQEEDVRGSTKTKYAGWSFVRRPTKKTSVCMGS